MNDKSIATSQLNALKKKLDTAIKSRTTLEDDFKNQSTMLIQFIGKLSQVCKGIDLELDNRLAKLRVLLSKSAPLCDIEGQIKLISKLLEQHSSSNDKNIRDIHEQFIISGKALQKSKGLPAKLRRDLRSLLSESAESKDALVQYIEPLIQLLSFYDKLLQTSKVSIEMDDSTDKANQASPQDNDENNNVVDQKVIKEFSDLLSSLISTDTHSKQLAKIKSSLTNEISNDKLLHSFLDTFNLLIDEFKQERNTAKTFLSTLSKTLTTVQTAVKNTLSTTEESKKKNNQLNLQLQQQITDMTGTVEIATSLSEIKIDINEKLQNIAGTLEEKSNFEQAQNKKLAKQLKDMESKVSKLETQSNSFEKRLQEQQIKSMQDALTKLHNRAAYDEHFAKEMVRYHHKKFDLAIVVIDLDDFKRINDTYGHTAGDKTLQVIAKTLKKQLPSDAFIGRYGGEEFVILFSGLNQSDLVRELNALRKYIARLPFKFKNTKVSITTSIGVSHVKPQDNVHIAFERADTALYQAKEKGKNKVVYL